MASSCAGCFKLSEVSLYNGQVSWDLVRRSLPPCCWRTRERDNVQTIKWTYVIAIQRGLVTANIFEKFTQESWLPWRMSGAPIVLVTKGGRLSDDIWCLKWPNKWWHEYYFKHKSINNFTLIFNYFSPDWWYRRRKYKSIIARPISSS